MFRLPAHWEGVVCVTGASIFTAGFLSFVIPFSPALRHPDLPCNTAAATQAVVSIHDFIFQIGVGFAAAVVLLAWVWFRVPGTPEESSVRSVRITALGFTLLLIAVIGFFVTLFVVPAVQCSA